MPSSPRDLWEKGAKVPQGEVKLVYIFLSKGGALPLLPSPFSHHSKEIMNDWLNASWHKVNKDNKGLLQVDNNISWFNQQNMLISSLQDQWTIQEGCLKVMYSLKVYISEVSLSSSRIKTNRDERESQSWQCPPRVFPIYGILPPGSQKENIAKLWKNQKITQFPPPPQDLEMGGGQQIMQIIHCYFPHPKCFFLSQHLRQPSW